MKGISEQQHQQLLKALQQLEALLNQRRPGEDLSALKAGYQQLDTMHRDYLLLLNKLACHIDAYDELYSELKVKYLGKKLKELKKQITAEKPGFLPLTENIRLVYGT